MNNGKKWVVLYGNGTAQKEFTSYSEAIEFQNEMVKRKDWSATIN